MNTVSQWTLDKFYGLLSRSHLYLFNEQSSLVTFLFHGLFRNKKEIALNIVDPQQGVTINNFREFVDYYLHHGYVFINPDDIIRGLKPGKNYVLITFDDGYYNNLLSLPVIKEYGVPATFLVSTSHVLENKCFWWDVVYRERTKRGVLPELLQKEYSTLKQRKNDEIESYLKNTFGTNALCPIGEVDRPFTPAELNIFSREPLVNIGNHTSSHAILTNYNREEIYQEITGAQKELSGITGKVPSIIAYPNGDCSDEIVAVSQEAGLRLGITVQPGKNYLPLNKEDNSLFKLNRFTLWGNQSVSRQCEFFRTEIHSKRIRRRFNMWNKAQRNIT